MSRTLIAALAASGFAVMAIAAPAAIAAPKSYTPAQVAKHSSSASCWTIVSKNVYDLSTFIAKHPGGAANILSLCGKDGTSKFLAQHGGQPSPTKTLAGYKIGTLKAS